MASFLSKGHGDVSCTFFSGSSSSLAVAIGISSEQYARLTKGTVRCIIPVSYDEPATTGHQLDRCSKAAAQKGHGANRAGS